MDFSSLGLEPDILKALLALGYEQPTPIQEQAIPPALAGRDIIGCAQTGTGKTVAFIVPALQHMLLGTQLDVSKGLATTRAANDRKRLIKTLGATPRGELAGQIEGVGGDCARYTGQRAAAFYGGVGYPPQLASLRRGVDLLVATPGRLLDLQSRGDVDLRHVEMLVLDEADRMLDMGFWPDVQRILRLLPEKRQNMLFSATLSTEVRRLASAALSEPLRIEVAPSATPVDQVQQVVYPVNALQKTELLANLLEGDQFGKVLVFTRTKHRADRVCRDLVRRKIHTEPIHSNRSQAQRQRALDDFKDGRCRVLVATDIVARGIDVDGISHVVNYDLPSKPEDYIHRIGRTARAGATGIALSLMASEETKELRQIEYLLGTTLACEDLEGFAYMERIVPMAERQARRPARLVYNGSARRRAPARRPGR
jgi:ATP-dependent RNA helicase RhlE